MLSSFFFASHFLFLHGEALAAAAQGLNKPGKKQLKFNHMMKHLQQSVLEGSAGLVSESSRENRGKELRLFAPLAQKNAKLLLAA